MQPILAGLHAPKGGQPPTLLTLHEIGASQGIDAQSRMDRLSALSQVAAFDTQKLGVVLVTIQQAQQQRVADQFNIGLYVPAMGLRAGDRLRLAPPPGKACSGMPAALPFVE